jgi:hypothetical protein
MEFYMASHDLPLPLHHLACLQGAEQELSQSLKFSWIPHIHLPKIISWIETQTSYEPKGSLSSQVDGYFPSSKSPPVHEERFMLMGHPSSLIPLKQFLQSLAMAQLDLGYPLLSFPSPSDIWVSVIVQQFWKLYLNFYPNKPSEHTTSKQFFQTPSNVSQGKVNALP